MRCFKYLIALFILVFVLVGCTDSESTSFETTIVTEPNIETCEYQFLDYYGQDLVIESINIPYSDVLTNTYNFISPCKETDENELIIVDSVLKTHQIFFNFDAIYPIETLEFVNYEGLDASSLEEVSIYYSIDGLSFDRIYDDYELIDGVNVINMDNKMIKSIKIVFDDQDQEVAIQDISFKLGDGVIIREETELTSLFLRSSGWVGADGIFTFDLNNGGDSVGIEHSNTAFIFSDTFIGDVNESLIRKDNEMINNTFGYWNDETNDIDFVWAETEGEPASVILPDAYTGQRARNLLDCDGLSVTDSPNATLTNHAEGNMWLSDDVSSELIIDLQAEYSVTSIFIWNYNGNIDYGVKEFDLYSSLDGTNYSFLGNYQIDKATGSATEGYTLDIAYNQNTTRYIKLVVTDTYSDEFVGLGKLMLFDVTGQKLFGEATASSEVLDKTDNEESARLWFQDGVVIDDKIYIFPLLIKDYLTFFQVNTVGLIEMDIVGNEFDYENANFLSTPLQQYTSDGGSIYFGCGVLDNRSIDGYIYVYGYKDLNGRNLIVSRVEEENFLNFNEWEYYAGDSWSRNIDDVVGLKEDVSAELSVTYMEEGIFAGKYMLVVMENTTSGKVSYALSDTPNGEFSEYVQIYETTEGDYLNGAFTYNAKLHPNLSTYDKLIISYNVNSSNTAAFTDANIYYPRFISITVVKREE